MTPIERDHGRGLNGALAAEIRSELAVREKTLTWLSQETQIERVTLRRYVKAERALNTALVETIAHALDVDPGELMARAVRRRNQHPRDYGTASDPEYPFDLQAVGDQPDEDAAQGRIDAFFSEEEQPPESAAGTTPEGEAGVRKDPPA